ncbi:MAG: DUF3160 domain-containing protein, partial [Flavobacteriales bacterium]|nr:DUF3160 domain-containing protein [Flavobacteriales bacterium]
MKISKLTAILALVILSCGDPQPKNVNSNSNNPQEQDHISPEEEVIEIGEPVNIGNIDIEAFYENIDLDMNIEDLSLAEIRIVRNAFAARQGYCFMKADLRGVFETTSWYSKKMHKRFWDEDSDKGVAPISYTSEEKSFIEKLRKREDELMRGNFEGQGLVNINNIINPFQFEELPIPLLQKLGQNGFAIVPNENIQLFHVYEQNDYQQVPNFVTTDMYMQLFHMYFGYLLKRIEQEKFIPVLENLCLDMKNEMEIRAANSNGEVQELAQFGSVFYAIAYTSLSDKKLDVKGAFAKYYDAELEKIDRAADDFSEFLDYKNVEFPYSLFKPRGHYTRTDELKRYFKSMMWLQTATYCLDKEQQFKNVLLNASILKNNANIRKAYQQILEPITFIIGETDNVSFLDVSKLMNTDFEVLIEDEQKMDQFRAKVEELAKSKNFIRPKIEMTCRDKINFMPQRYVFDNEILQELVDVKSQESKRAYPKGLDLFSALNCEAATSILNEELKVSEKWPEYDERMKKLRAKMSAKDMNKTVYSKWINTLKDLQKDHTDYPYFMQTKSWDKKDLNAALASWAELKHDAILYAEQPMAAECGDGGPPSPYTVGYVEPNIHYWNGLLELMNKTVDVLKSNNLMIADLQAVSSDLIEKITFLRDISEKELKGEKLSNREYEEIEYIGSDVEWMTLALVKNKDEYYDSWENVKGPDKSVSVIADIYTSNAEN